MSTTTRRHRLIRSTSPTRSAILAVEDGQAEQVALARVDEFADALAGASLPNAACILFTDGGPDAFLNPRTQDEMTRALRPGGRVYLLGGTNALSGRVQGTAENLGFDVRRLEGPTRFETAEAVAQEASLELGANGVFPTEVILGYALNWPDVITAGAYARANGALIALTDTDSLHPTAQRIINGSRPDRTYVIGGTAVISSVVESQVPGAVRVAGPNRMATAVAVAEQLWPSVPATGEDFVFANLDRADGWNLALAAAPLSARIGGPQLGVRTDALPAETQTYLQNQGIGSPPSLVVLGDLSFISENVVTQIEGATP